MHMENLTLINQIIAKNLTQYRKAAGLTQAELAEKINYSDKSVSKWESGNGVPDIYILIELAKIFGVTVDDLISESSAQKAQSKKTSLHVLIMLLSSGIVWLTATCIFAILSLIFPQGKWAVSFLWALPVNAIVLIVFSGIWRYRIVNFLSVSALIWTIITCLYVTVSVMGGEMAGLWVLFIIGAPLQVLEILWSFFRASLFKAKNRKKVGNNS